jgi:hypothetical protein
MTHKELVARAVRWLLKSERCYVALGEPYSTMVYELPDAIGWKRGWSILVECKVSRSDFLRDKHKLARHRVGMGQSRYFMTPKGIIKPEELPQGWGLLEVCGRVVRHVVAAKRAKPYDSDRARQELYLLLPLLWKMQNPGLDEGPEDIEESGAQLSLPF